MNTWDIWVQFLSSDIMDDFGSSISHEQMLVCDCNHYSMMYRWLFNNSEH